MLDTNVLSPSAVVLRWLAAHEPMKVFITTITQAGVLCGVEVMPTGKRRTRLPAAIGKLFLNEFEGRILCFDEASARAFATIVGGPEAMGRPISPFDAMIAAIARSRRAAVAICNVRDYPTNPSVFV